MLLGPLGQRVALCKTAPGSFVEPAPRVLKPADTNKKTTF